MKISSQAILGTCLVVLLTAFNANYTGRVNTINGNNAHIEFPEIGTIKSRNSKNIKSNNWSVGAETMDRGYTIYDNWKKYLGPLGVKKVRLQAGWAKTEKKKGVYNWAWLDHIIFDMVNRGVEPWMNVSYGNPNYGGGTQLGASMPQTKEAVKAWTRWVGAMTNRYNDYIDEWEIWNEGAYSGNSMEIYVNLYIPAAEAIRKVQPDATIIALAIAGVNPKVASEFLGIMKKKEKLDLVDQITYHPYNKNPDNSYDEVAKLRQAIHQYSDHITIRQGENGAPSEYRKTKALSHYKWTEVTQAKWALRRMLGDLGRDIPTSYFSIMDMNYPDEINRKGLLYATEDQKVGHVKPVYHVIQNLTAIFDSKLERILNYSYESTFKKSLSLFAYKNRFTQQQVVTIWQDGAIPSESDDKTPVDFTFYAGNFSDPAYVDMTTGKVYRIPDANWSKKGNMYQFTSIPIYDSPVLIIDLSNVPLDKD